jgi:hypothetical protein
MTSPGPELSYSGKWTCGSRDDGEVGFTSLESVGDQRGVCNNYGLNAEGVYCSCKMNFWPWMVRGNRRSDEYVCK